MAYKALTKMVLPFLDEVYEEVPVLDDNGDPRQDDDGKALTEKRQTSSGRVKNPGDTITEQELKDAKQGQEDIEALIADGAMEATHE